VGFEFPLHAVGYMPVRRRALGRIVGLVGRRGPLGLEAYVAYLTDVIADTGAVAVLVRASVVPPVGRGRSLREPLATLVTEQLAARAGVLVEFEFELGAEGPLAIATGVCHGSIFLSIS